MDNAVLLSFILSLMVLVLVVWLAKTSALLRDSLIPQIPPQRQTFSLAKNQMAFWFVIILSSFLYLFLKLNSTNVLSAQALTLMGISTLTAGGSALVDGIRDTPEDALNDALQALGLRSYQDVISLQTEIDHLKEQGNNLSVSDKAELNNKQLLLQVYKNRTKPFETAGWFKDLTTDINGMALHRLQTLVWTIILGCIFIYQVYHTGAMPTLNENLLALMGIINTGYAGFKYNETQY